MLRGYNGTYTERALAIIEKDVCYLARTNWGYGMPREEVEQELRFQVWRKIHLYNPGKKSFRTWAQQVMRNRLIDMTRTRKELLDSDRRMHIESEEYLYVVMHGDRRSHEPEEVFLIVDSQ